MDAIVAQIQSLAHSADDAGRLSIIRALRNVQLELLSPKDMMLEIAGSTLLLPVLRIGVDIGLFRQLVTASGSLTVDELTNACNASPQLMERFLRYLASMNVIEEVASNEYRANKTTHIIADPRGEGMVHQGFNLFGPVLQAVPEFFMENKYQDIENITNTPFQKAFNTNLSGFDWLVQNPKHFDSLQKVMTSLEGAEWTVGFDLLHTEIQNLSSIPADAPFLVDVGGGHGHQCVQLGKRYPNLLGRLVLQDMSESINNLAPIEGVRAEVHNFFEKQPITDAKFYYLRRIMHDWPDKEAADILRNIGSVMSADARILIDEAVLPDTGANWQATLNDLSVMILLGGKERSNQQWHSLAKLAGLRIEQIHTYVASTYTSILVLTRE